jgi:hypothetical protein
METIQYSLNKLGTRYSDKNIDNQPILLDIQIPTLDTFDSSILDLYGNKTCTFFPIDKENIEVKFLDSVTYDYIRKDQMYTLIPKLLQKAYTVIILIKIRKTGKKEITAIHTPH